MHKIICLLLSLFLLCSCYSPFNKEPLATSEAKPQESATSEPVEETIDFSLSYTSLYTNDFTSSWTNLNNNGVADVTFNYDSFNAYISYSGTNSNDITISRQGIPLLGGHEYIISFNAQSDIDKNINVSLLNTDYSSIYSQVITLSNSNNYYRYQFKYNGSNLFDAIYIFSLGGQELSDFNITISNVLIMDITSNNYSVKVNQVGYSTNSNKKAIFSYNEGDIFYVINANNNTIAYSGPIIYKGYDSDSDDTIYYGDFTELKDSGTYYIQTQIGGTSYPFVINDNPYSDLIDSLLYVFYLQRCGTSIDSKIEGFSHDICHNFDVVVKDSDEVYQINGGWHDAGDYGRYANTGAKAVLDLLLAYNINPSLFSDSNDIDESGNGISDILDEAKYELDWLLKMQARSGGIHSKVCTEDFANDVPPDKDSEKLGYLYPVRSDITAFVGGVFAYASTIYKDVDNSYSEKLLKAAIKCNDYITNNGSNIIDIRYDGFTQGVYDDKDETDQLFFLQASLYYVTKQQQYYDKAIQYLYDDVDTSGTSYINVGGYGIYLLAKSNLNNISEQDRELINSKLDNSYIEKANAIVSNGYNFSDYTYNWGSNGDQANNALYLALMYDLTNDNNALDLADSAISYLLGRNSLNICYVVGYGSVSPTIIHHRSAIYNKAYYIGALVGGPDQSCEDSVSSSCSGLPIGQIYFDDPQSYSTNEMSIYWNSALLASLAIRLK